MFALILSILWLVLIGVLAFAVIQVIKLGESVEKFSETCEKFSETREELIKTYEKLGKTIKKWGDSFKEIPKMDEERKGE